MRHRYTCHECGEEFKSYNPSPKFCSLRCKGDNQAADVDIEQLRSMYDSGMTQDEIAAQMEVSQKSIFTAMRRNGIAARVAAKRDQWGDKNHMWKGDDASYSAFHIRLWKRHEGKPICESCGRSNDGAWYDWANLTGKYEDMNDYKLMCRSCHRQYDASRKEVMPHDAETNQTP